jgi:hypothetical protein
MELITEYLIIIEKQTPEAFYRLCDSVERFNELLQVDPDIIVNGDAINFKKTFTCAYRITVGNLEEKSQRFFHIKLSFNGKEEDIDKYAELLRAIRFAINESGGQPETLWDDLSLYYSSKSYPLINKAENLMRKLITYFMLTNVGKEWVVEASPTVIQEAIVKSKRKEYVDVLHKIDFIQLGHFLFKSYQTRNVSELYEKIDNAQTLDELDLSDLKDFKARSNWDRYFSKVVDCTNEYLNKGWSDLYDLRCKVAHNAIVNKSDFQRIEQLVNDVGGYLQKAINNLDKVYVPTEDREQIAESVASSISAQYGDFIRLWKTFEAALEKADLDIDKSSPSVTPRTTKQALQLLYENEVIDDDVLKEGEELFLFRNRLVHDARVEFTEKEIAGYIFRLESLIRILRRSWKDEVFNALTALGGKAHVTEIYDYIKNNTTRDLPANWKSSVRKTLQLYSAGSKAYKEGNEDLFEHFEEKGYWGIKLLE